MTAGREARWRVSHRAFWVGYMAVLTTAVVAMVQFPRPAIARAALENYSAVAAADGVQDSLVVANAPLSDTVEDSRAPSAQSTVDALGNSIAFAALPYPGDTIVAAPGLVNSVIVSNGGPDIVPDYPLIANSRFPSKPDDSQCGGACTAHSTADQATGTATVGSSAPTNAAGRLAAAAKSSADASTGALAAEADSSADVVDVAGVLGIGSVHATASVTRDASGRITKTSSLAIEQATVAGVAVEITSKGVEAAGQHAALPDPSPVTKPLQSAGISVEVLRPHQTATGITSGALVITVAGTANGQKFTHTYTLGHARAELVASNAATAPVARAPSGAGNRAAVPATNAAPPTTAPATGGGGGGATTTAPAASSPQVAPPATQVFGDAAFARMWTGKFYLLLVIAALVILGAARLITTFAVRRTWTS